MATKFAATLRVDPELARISIGLNLASPFRLWVIARHLTRLGNGSGKVSKSEFKSTLRQYNISYTRQHLNRLLRAGEGIFWNSNPHELYARSGQYVAKHLTQQALDEHRDLLLNKAGVTEVLLSPCGSLEQWEATIYAGWLNHRNNPTISRLVLSKLFNRSDDTLRRWESERLKGTLTIRKNYAQCASTRTWEKVQPQTTVAYVAKTRSGEQMRLMWQLPNTYKIKGIKTHRHNGQSKKVRKSVNQQLKQPANLWRGGSRALKLYHNSPKNLQDYLKVHDGVFYLWRGENRHTHGIFEATETGWSETTAKERVSFSQERAVKAAGKIRISL